MVIEAERVLVNVTVSVVVPVTPLPSLAVAVMVAVPSATPLAKPEAASTVAFEISLLLHVTSLLAASAGSNAAVKRWGSPAATHGGGGGIGEEHCGRQLSGIPEYNPGRRGRNSDRRCFFGRDGQLNSACYAASVFRRGRDGYRAGCHAGYQTGGIHGSLGKIATAPRHPLVGGIFGKDCGRQLLGAPRPHTGEGGRDGNRSYFFERDGQFNGACYAASVFRRSRDGCRAFCHAGR